ncbi:hypothetical protein [Anaeromyxobacter dehalogenans]|nr:hypothetical protein [Anaeromyxobacter dehalogenans]
MRALWPSMKHRLGPPHHRTVVWEGYLQPTPESPRYFIRVTYGPYTLPKVFVLSPKLRTDAPHVYPKDRSLCLYWPEEWRWSDGESIADTIMGWAALWLYYYEVWTATGEWMGPESPHATGTPKSPAVAA